MEIKKDVGEIALSKKDFLTLSRLRKSEFIKVSSKDVDALTNAMSALDQDSEIKKRAGYCRVFKSFGMSRGIVQIINLQSEVCELLDLHSEFRLAKFKADREAAAQAEKEKIFAGAVQNSGPYSF